MSSRRPSTTTRSAPNRAELRPQYAENPDSLVAVAQVVAIEFATIAAANDYWR
ncbi:hexameric tyrosine-coordinated heme protein [Streptomyces cirratus]|uniref:hexameric tyrosine-coordinated heme protein n=1 Tax=Streptomyces cirratus TaxID=68187 RepID=UPI001E3D7CD3|nr:hexameric tyrosine-coordinated heme protein [Streptomyces cirratus]